MGIAQAVTPMVSCEMEALTMTRFLLTLTAAVALGAVLGGCATTPMDMSQAQAREGEPVAAQVAQLMVPYDPNLPRFVVAVNPLDYSASGQISGGGAPAQDKGIGKGLAAQLITSLTKGGNISVLDRAALVDNGDGTYSCKLQPNEIGPFLIKGTVTEFNETAEASAKESGGSLGRAGAIAGIAGAVTGNRDLTYAGAGVAAANPTMRKGKMKRSGMVAMDLQLLDCRSARIASSYRCSGTFTTMSSVSGMSLFGIGSTTSEFAASALGQATRAAMNDALRQTTQALRTAPQL